MSLTAPKALRLQIALTGKVNAGKSSFLNLVTGQETAIASAVPGTTTDVVEKNQELLPIGPVTWLDTAGFGDDTELSVQRIEKTRKVFDRADVILLVTDSPLADETEQAIIVEAEKRNLFFQRQIEIIQRFKFGVFFTHSDDFLRQIHGSRSAAGPGIG